MSTSLILGGIPTGTIGPSFQGTTYKEICYVPCVVSFVSQSLPDGTVSCISIRQRKQLFHGMHEHDEDPWGTHI